MSKANNAQAMGAAAALPSATKTEARTARTATETKENDMQTTEKQAHEAIKFNDCSIPSWHGQHLKRTTVLSATHIATVNAALTGIYAVVDVLHDREEQRNEGGQAHCPIENMGLLAAVHSLATLVRMHTEENAEGLPDFIRDTKGVREVGIAAYHHAMRRMAEQGKSAKWAQEQLHHQHKQEVAHHA